MASTRTPPKVLSTPPADRHIAACGLFCSECGSLKRGRCKGCQIKPGFGRCAVRQCCAEKDITTCAACDEFAGRDYRECRKVYSFISRVISFFTRSNRPASLAMLRDEGEDAYLAAHRPAQNEE